VSRRVRTLLLLVALGAAGAILSFRPVYEPDLGWHLAHGRENLAGSLVRTNLFSFTYPDYRQRYTSWLFDSAAYAAWALGGDAAVQALQAVLLASTFGFVYAACRIRSAALPSLAILILGFVVLEPRAIPRPHLVSFLGVAAIGWLLERAIAARSASPLIWAIPFVALWSNAHAECVFGVLMIGMFASAEAVWPAALPRSAAIRALVVAAGCALALLANPYGWGLLQYLVENATVPQLLAIAELQPAYLPGYRAFFAYLAITCLLLLLTVRRLTLWEGLAVVVFGALGVRYLRLTPLLFLVTAPMVAARLTALAARGIDARAMIVTALAASFVLARIPLPALVTEFQAGSLHPDTMFSPHAVRFVTDHGLNGPVFNSNNLGGWLAWRGYPNVRVFQDSRLQAYPPDHFRRIVESSRSLADWTDLVRAMDWAILSTPRPNALSGVGLFPSAQWATIFWDAGTEIVVRREGRFAELAREREYEVLHADADLSSLVPMLSSGDRDRLRAEARRHRLEYPDGFSAAAILCLADDDREACADAERIGAQHPAYRGELDLIRVLRSKG
jgi:hypothetical protein